MNRPRLAISPRTARYLLWTPALAYVALYVFVAASRMSYPFELEWMEGSVVDHVRRVLSGGEIYVEPTIDFTPFIYPPLYYYAGAALTKVLGVGFFPLRLLSFLASLGALAMVFLLVRRESGSATGGAAAAGLLAATFRAGGAWFDLARVDSLFLFLLLAGVYTLRFGTGVRAHAAAATLMWLSFLAKQSALPVAAAFCLYCILFLPKRIKPVFPAVFSILAVTSVLAFNAKSGGWYWYYVLGPAGNHHIGGNYFWKFWTHDIAARVPVAAAVSSYCLVGLLRGGRGGCAAFYWLFAASTVASSWVARMHMGGYDNVLIPAYAAIAVCFGLGSGVLIFERRTMEPERVSVRNIFHPGIVVIMCLIQFGWLYYNPRDQVPDRSDRYAGQRLIEILAAVEGEVFMPQHGYLPVLAGKNSCAHAVAVWDVLRGGDAEVAGRFMDHLTEQIRSGRYRTIVIDRPLFYMEELPGYELAAEVFDGDEFFPVTGKRTRPLGLYQRADRSYRKE